MSFLDTKSSSPETILVVDDEVLVRLPISEYLRQCGYRVLEAANADEALTILQKGGDVQVDVVLSDIEMPGSIGGFGLSRWIRTNRPGINVVLVSTPRRAADAAAELCDSGPTLTKPYEPKIVLQRIKALLTERNRLDIKRTPPKERA
jgi:CheY-like chemotaxis protein